MPELSTASKAMGSLSLETTTTTTPPPPPPADSSSNSKEPQQKGKGKGKGQGQATTKKKKTAEVLDSWEDASSDSESEVIPTPLTSTTTNTDTDTGTGTGTPTHESTGGFRAPPPTPASPSNYGADSMPWAQQLGAVTEEAATRQPPSRREHAGSGSSDGDSGSGRRPEKTDAVARRMIAGALGVRAPRPTEEQRAYDRAVREKERRRRDDERDAERRRLEDRERARAAIWND